MSRNDGWVELWQLSVGVCPRTDTGVILIGDVIQANHCLILAETIDTETLRQVSG